MAAADAERARRVLINGAGPARVVQQGPSRYLFQSGGTYATEGEGLLQLLKAQGVTRLHILAREELVTREMAEAMRLAALAMGFAAPEVEVYALYTMDFAPYVIRAELAQAQAWIAFGEVRDAAEMVKTFKKLGYTPALFFARKAADPGFIAAVGQDGEFTLAAVDYDPRMARPANSAFVKAFTARWSKAPGVAAAEGYAAASVLGEAVRRTGTLEQEKLRETLAGMQMDTVLGTYRVGPNGEQLGVTAAVAQIQRGRAEIVWPPDLQTAQPLQPYLRWGERKVLK
jgi:branched-chain amino acid transport system substrate-binding protein